MERDLKTSADDPPVATVSSSETFAPTPPTATPSSLLHAVALFEGVKGFAAMAASVGLLSLAHHDIRALAFALIGHFHLDPEAHYPRILLDEALWLQSANIRQVVAFACAYAALRFVEGYGLWKDKTWAEWLASGSGAMYLPVEVHHLLTHPTMINAAVLVFNLLIVVYMVRRLWQQKHMRVKARSSRGL
jgi:uncharacterized membrane protein (DUF2068 family)